MIRSRPKKITYMRHCVASLMAVLLLLGQSVAIGAVTGSGGAGWMEICGNADVKFVQQGEESQKESCQHCENCLVQVSATPGSLPPAFSNAGLTNFTSVLFVSGQSADVYRAEQFWAANRGPPLKNEETNTMAFFSREMIKLGLIELGAWGFPWV